MKVTTVRFGADLWTLLSAEAERAGVSVSQYVREAALARAAFSAGTRAGVPAELLSAWADGALDDDASAAEKRRAASQLSAALDLDQRAADGARLRELNRETVEETAALLGQARQTARHAQEMRRARRNDD
jgi:hypothetical protein